MCDVGVAHQSQGLPLTVETRQDLLRLHPPFDELERHPSPHRLELLGLEDLPHSPFTELLPETEARDRLREFLLRRQFFGGLIGLNGWRVLLFVRHG